MYRVSNCVDAGMYQFWPRGVRYTCKKNRTALMLECPSSGLVRHTCTENGTALMLKCLAFQMTSESDPDDICCG